MSLLCGEPELESNVSSPQWRLVHVYCVWSSSPSIESLLSMYVREVRWINQKDSQLRISPAVGAGPHIQTLQQATIAGLPSQFLRPQS